jgi:hypothetical protein
MDEIQAFSEYAAYISNSYVVDNNGIELTKLGKKKSDVSVAVDLKGPILIDLEKAKHEFVEVTRYLEGKCLPGYLYKKPIWYRINVLDQAVNDYIGIGFLDIEQNWLSFTINYLSCDRAEQSGDTVMAIFDRGFNWAVCFTLSQDNKTLQVELFEK